MKYAFIRDHRQQFDVTAQCRVLGVSRSGYYDWYRRKPSRRARENQRLLGDIQRLHVRNREAYGASKIRRALADEGKRYGLNRIIRLRRAHGIVTRRRRRFVLTTRSKAHDWVAPNLLARDFAASVPNKVWVTDVTFVPTQAGWLYLAVILDLFSRKVIGWETSNRNNGVLVMAALDKAVAQRQPAPGLIHHSDRGRLYASQAYRDRLATYQMRPSMSRKGDCWDNAVAESFFATLENELFLAEPFENRIQARSELFRFIEGFYNHQRLHATLGYRSPERFEMAAAA
jgi:transposase InsO family protein